MLYNIIVVITLICFSTQNVAWAMLGNLESASIDSKTTYPKLEESLEFTDFFDPPTAEIIPAALQASTSSEDYKRAVITLYRELVVIIFGGIDPNAQVPTPIRSSATPEDWERAAKILNYWIQYARFQNPVSLDLHTTDLDLTTMNQIFALQTKKTELRALARQFLPLDTSGSFMNDLEDIYSGDSGEFLIVWSQVTGLLLLSQMLFLIMLMTCSDVRCWADSCPPEYYIEKKHDCFKKHAAAHGGLISLYALPHVVAVGYCASNSACRVSARMLQNAHRSIVKYFEERRLNQVDSQLNHSANSLMKELPLPNILMLLND